jgi:hypothetical protein
MSLINEFDRLATALNAVLARAESQLSASSDEHYAGNSAEVLRLNLACQAYRRDLVRLAQMATELKHLAAQCERAPRCVDLLKARAASVPRIAAGDLIAF